VTTFDVRTVKLRSGEQFRDVRQVELEPFELGGERYLPVPDEPEAAFTMSRVTSGLLFELEFETRLVGPCFRCLADARVVTVVQAQEYHATNPGDSDELRTPYLTDDRLDLSAWARDAVALSLPEQILCRSDCAGLCGGCGADLNVEECVCAPPEPDARWAKLAEIKERL
jgi:uncharacterized protein